MTDPIRHRQLSELNMVEVCTEILQFSRNELYLNMRFMDVALSSLGMEADYGCKTLGTDGFIIYYQPEYLIELFRRSRILVNRGFLHMVLHCLFCHMYGRKDRDELYWNLACDIAMESIIDGLYQKCTHIQSSPYRRELYQRLGKRLPVFTAEGIYQVLWEMKLDEKQYHRLASEFYVDSHEYWEWDNPAPKTMERQKNWDDNREKMQTELEAFANEASEDLKNLLNQIQIENRERYDYKQFLRKFAVLKEEIQVDEDSFDYIYYTYGLNLYGNMPLIEPLETKEIYGIEDFVLVIDTSMSCSGELVRRFLEETYTVLSESETYFRKIHIHIIQCDDQIQSDVIITSQEEMDEYMQNFTIAGQGGTDYRPAFEYVNQLIHKGEFKKLKGLLYFTDGQGIFPVKMPVYDTAFVFIKDQYTDISVPPWAIKLILTQEELKLEGKPI